MQEPGALRAVHGNAGADRASVYDDLPGMVADLREPGALKPLRAVFAPRVAVEHPAVVVGPCARAGEARSGGESVEVLEYLRALHDQELQRAGPAAEHREGPAALDGHLVSVFVDPELRLRVVCLGLLGRLRVEENLVARHGVALLRPGMVDLREELDVGEDLPVPADRRERRVERGDRERTLGERRDAGNLERALRDLLAVREERPAPVELRRVREAEPVPEDKPCSLFGITSSALHDQILVDVSDLDELGAHVAERIDHSVAAERSVVREVVEVPAVGEVAVARAGLGVDAVGVLPDRLVHPVPDASADERRIGVDDVPVLLEVSDGVAHRVRVLAHDEGLPRAVLRGERLVLLGHAGRARLLVAELAAALEPFDGRIHRRVNVRVLVAALPVHWASGVRLLDGLYRRAEAVAVSGLVAKRPDRNRRMVAVELDLAAVALDYRVLPLLEETEPLVPVSGLVRLYVRLGDHVDSVAVAEVVPEVVVRIVARAHRVDVELLEERDVLHHVRERDGASVVRIRLVAVHALELHGHSVDVERVADDLLLLEADLPRADVIALLHDERVEIGVLGAPEAGQG